jgi:pimeloyl-ACP methyl ester carboxylesterase
MVRIDMMRRLLFSPDMPTAKLYEIFDYVQAESQVVSLDMMGLNPLRLKPDQVKTPILVLGARHDVFVSPALVEETARFYRAECRVFPSMAHAMMLELKTGATRRITCWAGSSARLPAGRQPAGAA